MNLLSDIQQSIAQIQIYFHHEDWRVPPSALVLSLCKLVGPA